MGERRPDQAPNDATRVPCPSPKWTQDLRARAAGVGGEEEPPTEEMHTWQMHGDHRVKSRRGATTENYTKATHEMQVT